MSLGAVDTSSSVFSVDFLRSGSVIHPVLNLFCRVRITNNNKLEWMLIASPPLLLPLPESPPFPSLGLHYMLCICSLVNRSVGFPYYLWWSRHSLTSEFVGSQDSSETFFAAVLVRARGGGSWRILSWQSAVVARHLEDGERVWTGCFPPFVQHIGRWPYNMTKWRDNERAAPPHVEVLGGVRCIWCHLEALSIDVIVI